MNNSQPNPEAKSRWFGWQPKIQNITAIPVSSPSKPTKPANEDSNGTRIIDHRKVMHIYFEDKVEIVFKDDGERYWHHGFQDKETTELIPGRPDSEGTIPREVWENFGHLLGLLILRKQRHGEHEDR